MNEPIAKVTVSREGGGWPPVLGSRIVTDTAILQAFGATMIHWSFGEAVVEDLIAGLLGVPPVHAYSLTANINISSRCHSIRALARQCLVASDFSEFDSALSQFEALIPLRNKLVHGLWSQTDDPEITLVSLVKSKGTLKHQSEFINLSYLEWLTHQIERAAMLLFNFGLKHNLIKGRHPNVGGDGNRECGFPQDASALMSQMQPVGHCAGSIRVCENDLAI